ncbi:hypothetical protein D3C72_2432690 [compost metagenome]
MARAGSPVKGTRHRINEILGSGALAVQIARNLMHDTERLERVIEDIYAFIKGGPLPPLPNDSD